MVFVLVSRSRRVVPDELVTLTSWDARHFLIFLVMVGWKGKDAVKDGVVALSCLGIFKKMVPVSFYAQKIIVFSYYDLDPELS